MLVTPPTPPPCIAEEAFFQSIHTRLIIIKSDPMVMQEIKNINIPNDIGVELKMI
jgi:ribosomal protein S10